MRRGIVFAVVSMAVLATGAWLARRSSASAPGQVTVTFTCDVHGRLTPCGCFSGQMGGLTRIASLLRSVPSDEPIHVDVGNAIEGTSDYQVIQYRYILRAFHEMGYEAANVGHAEAQLSLPELRKLKEFSPVPLLSANLTDRTTGAPLFDAYRIIQRGSWRLALVGVLDERLQPERLGEGLSIEPMAAALSRLLPALKKESDFIILLAFTDEARLREIARQFYEIQVILGGNVSQPAQRLERENRSLILFTTNQSRALGTFSATLSAAGKITNPKGEVILVNTHVPEDPSILHLSDAYRVEIRQAKLEIDDPSFIQKDFVPGVKAVGQYAGSQSCIQCHPSAAQAWEASGHSHAFKALVEKGADADPNCIGCHTVGFRAPSGYRREYGASRLTAVGCESCHGPGNTHVAQHTVPGGEITAHFRPLGAGDCQKCHQGEFSRPFDWNLFWPAIQHGKEPFSLLPKGAK